MRLIKFGLKNLRERRVAASDLRRFSQYVMTWDLTLFLKVEGLGVDEVRRKKSKEDSFLLGFDTGPIIVIDDT